MLVARASVPTLWEGGVIRAGSWDATLYTYSSTHTTQPYGTLDTASFEAHAQRLGASHRLSPSVRNGWGSNWPRTCDR
jgi:hypothetical protein